MDVEELRRDLVSRSFYAYGPELKLIYPTLGFSEEAGEVVGKVKKAIRDDGYPVRPISFERRNKILAEIGDSLFYMSMLLEDLDATFAEVYLLFVAKNEGRVERGTMHGDGDDR